MRPRKSHPIRSLARKATSAQSEGKFPPDYKAILDTSSSKNRNFLIAFLIIQVYLAVTVSSTTDLQLLVPNSLIPLPLVNFSVPLFGFYIIAPLLLLTFHLNLLFNLHQHSQKLFAWAETADDTAKSRLLHPFLFNALVRYKPGQFSYLLLRFILFALIYVFPLFVLISIQWRFSDYHGLPMTVLHFLLVQIDIGLLGIYWHRVVDPLKYTSSETWSGLWQIQLEHNTGWVPLWKLSQVIVVALPWVGLAFWSPDWGVVIWEEIDGFWEIAYLWGIFVSLCLGAAFHWEQLGRMTPIWNVLWLFGQSLFLVGMARLLYAIAKISIKFGLRLFKNRSILLNESEKQPMIQTRFIIFEASIIFFGQTAILVNLYFL